MNFQEFEKSPWRAFAILFKISPKTVVLIQITFLFSYFLQKFYLQLFHVQPSQILSNRENKLPSIYYSYHSKNQSTTLCYCTMNTSFPEKISSLTQIRKTEVRRQKDMQMLCIANTNLKKLVQAIFTLCSYVFKIG